ncbi:MAG: HEPN domain-containing protein [Terracidiphilus sp.]
MNRIELQEISEVRLREYRALLNAGFAEGAYYLAGYAVECALKACIAKRTQEHDFPEKKFVNDSHTHNLKILLQLAELKTELDTIIEVDPAMESVMDRVQEWSETSRYQRKTAQEADALLKAIEEGKGGLLPWIRLHW